MVKRHSEVLGVQVQNQGQDYKGALGGRIGISNNR